MTPLYDLNLPPSPFPLEDPNQHLQFFVSLPQHNASSSVHKPEEPKPYDLKGNDYMSDDGRSSNRQANSSSCSRNGDCEIPSDHSNNESSVKWMSYKIRTMKKMNSNSGSPPLADHNSEADYNKFRYPVHDVNETISFSKTNNGIRVCSDCNTTTTPLWRSGPRGPRSLCNACGIRQRKARRALEAAAAEANGTVVVKEKDAISMKIKLHNKKEMKKSRTVHVGQFKKPFHHQRQKKLCFKKFALCLSKNSAPQRVFPQDVEDAAILLMELSCGLFHS